MNTILGALPYWHFGPWTPIDALPWLKVHAFGTAVAIGLLVALIVGGLRAEKKLGIQSERFQDFGLLLIAVGWIFAHMLNVVFYKPWTIAEDPLILFRIWGAISSYGGLIGGIVGLYIWYYFNRDEDFRLWADQGTWALVFAWFFGRIGCGLVHDHPGVTAPASWPLAIEFPDGTIRHDLGFYEAIWWGVLVVIVLWLDRKPRRKGLYTALVPILYAPVRFTLDFFRPWPETAGGNTTAPEWVQQFLEFFGSQPGAYKYGMDTRYLGLTPAQYLSIALFIFGLVMAYRIRDEEPIEWTQYEHNPREES